MEGCIFDIKRFSTDDGPGIRSVVFLKGCNMRCLWCHNPESLSSKLQVMFQPEKCIGCGACMQVCPAGVHTCDGEGRHFYPERCKGCGRCSQVCHTGALTQVGKGMEPAEVLAELRRDEAYYKNSGGGITVSGGEPLLQIDFLEELLRLCKEAGLHRAIETAGNVPWKSLERIAPLTDLFLYDCKAADDGLHRRLTGAGNERILKNLQTLSGAGAQIWVRTPVVPGCNDDEHQIEQIHRLARSLKGVVHYSLLPYHALGEDKYESVGLHYPLKGLEAPSAEQMARLKRYEF